MTGACTGDRSCCSTGAYYDNQFIHGLNVNYTKHNPALEASGCAPRADISDFSLGFAEGSLAKMISKGIKVGSCIQAAGMKPRMPRPPSRAPANNMCVSTALSISRLTRADVDDNIVQWDCLRTFGPKSGNDSTSFPSTPWIRASFVTSVWRSLNRQLRIGAK